MKVIRKKPGEAPEICEVEQALDALPAGVAEYVQRFRFASDCVILYLGFPQNNLRPNLAFVGKRFYGTILAAGVDGDELCGLDPIVAETLMNWLGVRKTWLS